MGALFCRLLYTYVKNGVDMRQRNETEQETSMVKRPSQLQEICLQYVLGIWGEGPAW